MESKNWRKVLGSEIGAVVLTLGALFGCKLMGGGATITAITAIIVVVALVLTITITTATALVTALAALGLALATITTTVALGLALATITVIATIALAIGIDNISKEYKLPKIWVTASYLAEAAAIFFPIYLSLN